MSLVIHEQRKNAIAISLQDIQCIRHNHVACFSALVFMPF